MSLPKRRRTPKMNCNATPQIRNAGHLKWIRGHECAVADTGVSSCGGKIEAAHVRTGTNGCTSVKPGDNWTIPLCSVHHAGQHRVGEAAFEKAHGINMKTLAERLWQSSPHRVKLMRPTP